MISREVPTGVSELVLRAVSSRKHQRGDAFRIRHPYKDDGTVCTADDKDPAMTITRIKKGLMYHCFRCGIRGFIENGKLSPQQTVERLVRAQEKHVSKVEKVQLPYDYKPMFNEKDNDVPWGAYHWIWKYSLTGSDMEKWGIGYSAAYDRVILPVYEYALLGDDECKKLVGWVGRELKYNSKKERAKAKVAKYLTKTTSNSHRSYFTCPGSDEVANNTVILVEDILSAIKVWNSLGGKVTTMALLTTSIGTDLLRWLRNRKTFLWLDGDMLAESVRQVAKMRDLGIPAFHIHTPKDPKDYNTVYIADLWGRRTLK
jgi:hypothetical protein